MLEMMMQMANLIPIEGLVAEMKVKIDQWEKAPKNKLYKRQMVDAINIVTLKTLIEEHGLKKTREMMEGNQNSIFTIHSN